jgi:hypothetical protein
MECREGELHLRFDARRMRDLKPRGSRDQVLEERAFAHSRVAPHHQDLTLATSHGVEQILERAALGSTPGQCRGRRARSEVNATVDGRP